jgi:hypothetical protein
MSFLQAKVENPESRAQAHSSQQRQPEAGNNVMHDSKQTITPSSSIVNTQSVSQTQRALPNLEISNAKAVILVELAQRKNKRAADNQALTERLFKKNPEKRKRHSCLVVGSGNEGRINKEGFDAKTKQEPIDKHVVETRPTEAPSPISFLEFCRLQKQQATQQQNRRQCIHCRYAFGTIPNCNCNIANNNEEAASSGIDIP